MLKNNQNSQTQFEDILSIMGNASKNKHMEAEDKLRLDRVLRKKRSESYMKCMKNLDAGGHVRNQNQVNDIINIIVKEFPEVDLKGILKGIVSKCYLGDSYEVHILDISGQIVEHYKNGEILPNGLERARTIAMRADYAFIEVYEDCCRAVSFNGMVSVIMNES